MFKTRSHWGGIYFLTKNCYSIGEECLKCQKIGHDKMNCGCIVFLDEKIYEVDSDFPSRVNK